MKSHFQPYRRRVEKCGSAAHSSGSFSTLTWYMMLRHLDHAHAYASGFATIQRIPTLDDFDLLP
jgi:hypothetical protein